METPVRKMKSYESEKIAFYNWVSKWVTEKNYSIEEVDVDTPQIVTVLQAMGFKLKTVDNCKKEEQASNNLWGLNIEVKCDKSGMRAVLFKQMETCLCPNSDIENKGQFWSVSGLGPSCNQIDETFSSLIPSLPKSKIMLVRDILHKLFVTVAETDINQNNTKKVDIIRQNMWEMDTKITPPIQTSSPLLVKYDAMNQTFSQNGKQQKLTEILLSIRSNVDTALLLLPTKNITFTKNVKRVSNISPTIVTPTRATTGSATSNLPIKKTPKKKLKNDITPKSSTSSATGKKVGVQSKIGSFRKKTDTLAINSKLKVVKTNISPATSTKLLSAISKSSSVIPKITSKISK